MPATLPVDVGIQFAAQAGKFHINQITDPSGVPLEVLDKDLGFSVSGSVTLPAWLSGKGLVNLAADEIGGPIDKLIGSTTFSVTGGPEGTQSTYKWSMTVKPIPVDEDKMYQLTLVFLLRNDAGMHTDIAGCYDLGAYLVV